MPKRVVVVYAEGAFLFVDSDDQKAIKEALERRGIGGAVGVATAHTLDELNDPNIEFLMANQIEPMSGWFDAHGFRPLEFAKVNADTLVHELDDDD